MCVICGFEATEGRMIERVEETHGVRKKVCDRKRERERVRERECEREREGGREMLEDMSPYKLS